MTPSPAETSAARDESTGASEDRQVAILIRAVHRLARHRTYREVTVAEILAETGLGTRAFYRHFGSKDDLLVATFAYETTLVVEQLSASMADEPSAAAQFERWIDWYVSMLSEPRRLERFMVLQQEHDRLIRGHRDRMIRLDRDRDAILVSILERGVADGSFPLAQPVDDAPIIHSLITGLLRKAANEGEDPAETRRRFRRFCDPVLGC